MVGVDGYFLLTQMRAVIQNWGEYFAQMGNCDLEGFAFQAGCDDISEVRKAPDSNKKEGSSRMANIESNVGSLEDLFTHCLTKSVNMFHRGRNDSSSENDRGMGAIGILMMNFY